MQKPNYTPRIVRVEHPERVNLVFFTDVHAAAKAPGRRKATYGEEILSKLRWVAELTKTVKGAGICGGDLFHVKNSESKSNTTGYVTQVMGALQAFPQGCVYGIVGNHDITGDSMTTLADQPLGNLMQSGTYHDLGYQSVLFEAKDGTRVLVEAFDYMPGDVLLEKVLARGQEINNTLTSYEVHQIHWDDRFAHYYVAVLHAFNQPGKSGVMFNSDFALGHADLAETGYDAILWGHDHSRKGIFQVESLKGPTHVQLGSLARAALAQDEVDRPVSVPILSFSKEGMKVVEKEVPVRPLELAFHTADIAVEKVEKREDVAQFLAELDRHAVVVDSENPVEILTTLTEDPGIIETIKEACELH